MTRFSLGRDDDNEKGPNNSTNRHVPKRRRTFARTFSCADFHRRQEQEHEREREREERFDEEEEEEEHEAWDS